ncbi:DUF2306 domain-containing protein [Maricaulaceae bacterium EIL42A08]|nr:DUF2306 domain-containing protein [Maricaulaceae bacterium EIL42A08]
MNPDTLLTAPWHIQLHAVCALGALVLGVVQLTAPKGTLPHRAFGYIWVGLMAITAVTAIFIQSGGTFSWIHIFVPMVLISIVHLSWRARKGLTTGHRRIALNLFFGALLIPGAFAFMPGRLMQATLFG